MKTCSKCLQNKDLTEFNKDSRNKDHLYYLCKMCHRAGQKERCKKWREANRELSRVRYKNWSKNNKSKLALRERIKKQNLNYKLSGILRSRLYGALHGGCKSGSAVKDLGCSIEKFKLWIEMHWQDGMNWNNHGDWHLDHKIPLSKFNLSDRQQLLLACHYTNIQPLWAFDNLSKNNKIIGENNCAK